MVDEIELFHIAGKKIRFLQRRIAAADHRHGLAPIQRAVAGAAVGNAAAFEFFFAGKPQRTGFRPGSGDDRFGGVFAFVCFDLPGAVIGHNGKDFFGDDLRAPSFRLFGEEVTEGKTVDAVGKSGVIVNPVGQRHLSAGQTGVGHENGQTGSCAVDGGGESAGTGADDENIVDHVDRSCFFFVVCRKKRILSIIAQNPLRKQDVPFLFEKNDIMAKKGGYDGFALFEIF